MSLSKLSHALCVGVALVSAAFAQDAQPTASTITWSPYEALGPDRKPVAAELGRLHVPENRSRPDGPTIELAFVRFRSSNPEPGPPLFYLVGGPGPSGVEYSARLALGRVLRMLDTCDVIGIDQRGTGLSRPNLEDGPTFAYEAPLEEALTRDVLIAAHSQAVARCVEHWRAQGVDLKSYNTAESAEDLESLRAALGLDRIRLWGESYGTHLALAYLRKHSERVACAVLSRVEGPDHTLKLPSITQRYLDQLHDLVAADPDAPEEMRDFRKVVSELLKQLASDPVRAVAEVDGKPTSVVLGPFDLQSYLANALGSALRLRDAPEAVRRMRAGDWSDLANAAVELRRGEVGSAMALMMDCSSGASPGRLRRLETERADPRNLLSDAVNLPYPYSCAACGSPDLGDAFRTTLRCDARVLFVSGSLDARTPPDNVDELIDGFPHGVHVRVENAGHEPLEVLSAEFRERLAAFLRGDAVESCTVSIPAVRFRWASAK